MVHLSHSDGIRLYPLSPVVLNKVATSYSVSTKYSQVFVTEFLKFQNFVINKTHHHYTFIIHICLLLYLYIVEMLIIYYNIASHDHVRE